MELFDIKKFIGEPDYKLVLKEFRYDDVPQRILPVCNYQVVFDERVAIKCPELFEGVIITGNEDMRNQHADLVALLYMTKEADICEDFIPNIPEDDSDEEVVLDALFFDGISAMAYKDKSGKMRYMKLTYPTLEKCNASRKRRETINDYRYAGEEPEDFTITYSDSAMCFARINFITAKKYRELVETIIGDKTERTKHLPCSQKVAELLYKHVLAEHKKGYKYLLVYRNQKELLERMDNKLYTISDTDGKYLCDLLEQDYTNLTDELIILDRNLCEDGIDYMSDWVLADEAYKQEVMSRRVAIILTEGEWITL